MSGMGLIHKSNQIRVWFIIYMLQFIEYILKVTIYRKAIDRKIETAIIKENNRKGRRKGIELEINIDQIYLPPEDTKQIERLINN